MATVTRRGMCGCMHENGGWVQVGGDIDGEAGSDWLGESVSLSGDGLTVAVGASGSMATATIRGMCGFSRGPRVTLRVGAGWWRYDGEAGDWSGSSVSLFMMVRRLRSVPPATVAATTPRGTWSRGPR